MRRAIAGIVSRAASSPKHNKRIADNGMSVTIKHNVITLTFLARQNTLGMAYDGISSMAQWRKRRQRGVNNDNDGKRHVNTIAL